MAVIPDLRLAEKTESRTLNHLCRVLEFFRSKKHRGAEDALECRNQAAILFSAFMHAKCVQHFRGGAKSNGLALLSHSPSFSNADT